MASTDLLFELGATTSPNLLFGEQFLAPNATLVLAATMPALAGSQRLHNCQRVTFRALLPVMSGTHRLVHDNITQRPTVATVTTRAKVAAATQCGIAQPESHAAPSNFGFEARQQVATSITANQSMAFTEALRQTIGTLGSFADGALYRDGFNGRMQEGDRKARLDLHGAMQEGNQARSSLGGRFQDGLRDRRRWVQSRAQDAQRAGNQIGQRGNYAVPASRAWHGRFQESWSPPAGQTLLMPEIPVTPLPYWGTALLFACPPLAAPMLVFGIRQCGQSDFPEEPPTGVVTVAVRKVYFVINDVSLRRASNGLDVPVHSLSLSLDASSWAWGFDAVLPHSAQSLIEPNSAGVVELLASVNGNTFAVLAENISRERSFGQTSIRLTGRGRNAVLAAPYAPVMTFTNSQARTARQLMDDVLTINGVTNGPSLGWSVDWGLTDWNVPAGVFSHQGTWIEALSVIAGAAGGYLLPHPRDQTIRVRHRYRVAPWEWGTVTPDFVLPVDAIEKESLRWLEKPSYNRVFVSGVDAGVMAQVTRSGTAGDSLAPMVVDALITEAAVARQRGLAVLSDTGRQIEVSLNLPVLHETGIIEPGAFVQYRDGGVDRIGLVRSTQVQAGFPEVWQTLGVQTYA